MNLKYWLFQLFVLISLTSVSQEFKDEEERLKYANNLFDEGKYREAEPHMSHFLGLNPTSAEFNFKFGACLLHTSNNKEESIKHLRYAARQGGVDSRVIFFLGKAYHLTYLFNAAITEYERFIKYGEDKDKKALQVDLHLSMAKSGKKLLQNLTELVVYDKKESSYERFQYSYDLGQIGGKILVTDEFQSKLDIKKGHRPLVYFPARNNDIIFFSSYGKDGENGLDLYKIRRLPSGKWSEAELLPSQINTPYDDDFGFLHADGETFYFCSKGHSSMGGYDVFKTTYDATSNTFGTPKNLDYKINTPDDDIMYVVDSLNQNAYFASARAANGGYLDVYKVGVKTFPLLNVILAGGFINEIHPEDTKAIIKIEDASTGQEVGVFGADEKGEYILVVPKPGKYKLIVETPKSEKIHTGMVEVPSQEKLRPLKQELLLVNRNEEEQLIIRNLFDQDVANADEIIAKVMQGLADPRINVDEFTEEQLALNKGDVLDDVLAGNTTVEALQEMVNSLVEETQKEANDITSKMNAAYSVAANKSEESAKEAKLAEEILSGVENITDPEEKASKIKEANAHHNRSKELNKQATVAVSLGDNLKKEQVKKQQEADESKQVAIVFESAMSKTSHEEAIAELENVQEQLQDIMGRDADILNKKNIYDKLLEAARVFQDDADVKLQEATEYRAEQDAINNRLSRLNDQYSRAKDKDKADLQVQIDDLEEQKKMADDMVKTSFEKNLELQAKADAFKYQAELLEQMSSGDIVMDREYSDEEKETISSNISSESSTIDNNENLLANYSDLESNSESTDNESNETNDTTNDVVYDGEYSGDDYTEFENEIENAETIEDPIEKAKKENEVHQNWIDILDGDIEDLTAKIHEEENSDAKRKLENELIALLQLKEEKEFLINKNNELIAAESETTETTDNVVASNITEEEILNSYTSYENELEEVNSISDPVERAKKENEINNSILAILEEELQDAKDQLVLEEDPQNKANLESKINTLNEFKTKKEGIVASNTLIIEEAESNSVADNNETTDTETTDVVENNETVETNKYEKYEDQLLATNSISDPVEKARKENEINEAWMAELKNEAKEMKGEMDAEEDPGKQTMLLMSLNRKFREIAEREKAIEDNNTLIANETGLATNESNGNASDYDNLVSTVENNSSNPSDFEKTYETSTSYSSLSAKEKANGVADKIDELSLKEQEILSLEEDLNNEVKDKKRIKIKQDIAKKQEEINTLELEIATELAEANSIEKSENEESLTEVKSHLPGDLNINNDKKFIEANYYEEKANANFEEANNLRSKADNTENTEEKAELLNEAHRNELAGNANQQKAIESYEAMTEENYVADYISTTDDLAENKSTDVVENTETTDTETTDVVENTETTDTETTDVVENTETTDTETTDVVGNTETTDTESAKTVKIEEVAGYTFDPNEENIETYTVSTVTENKELNEIRYNSGASKKILVKNQEDIDEIASLNADIKTLQDEADATDSEKEKKKLEKGVAKLEKIKVKKELALANVFNSANAKEIEIATTGMNTAKNGATEYAETFSARQAAQYENAANELLAEAEKLGAAAAREKDKTRKNIYLKQAASKEAVAVEYYNKANKLYSEAIVEASENKTNEISSVPENEEERVSGELMLKSGIARREANDYTDYAAHLRDSALSLKEDKQLDVNHEADKYDVMASAKDKEARNFEIEANKAKEIEDAIIEEEKLLANLTEEEITPIRESNEYKEFYKGQKEIESLNKLVEIEEERVEDLENLAVQQENKAKDLREKSKMTSDETEKEDLLQKAFELEEQATSNRTKKMAAAAIVEDLYNKIEEKTQERDNSIAKLDSETQDDFKALAISSYDKDPIERVEPMGVMSLLAADFIPPAELKNTIFKIDTSASYSDQNPIPVNPAYPDGLVYKVQVGAFRNPIPQDLFKGFAPISAELIRDGITRYRVGYFTGWEIANQAKNEIRGMGYSDAFVVAIYNGNYMPLAEARKLEQEGVAAGTIVVENVTNFREDNNATANNTNVTNNTANNTTANNNTTTTANNNTNNTVPEYVANLGEGAANVEAVEVIEGMFYTVQIGAFSKPIQANNVFNVSPLVTKFVNGLYKYSTGIFRTVGEAVSRKDEMHQRGLSDAFVTAYYNGEKITIDKANQLVAEQGESVYAVDVDGTIHKAGGTTVPSNNDNNSVERTNEVPKERDKIPDNVVMITVAPTNVGTEYYVDLGTYENSAPEEIATALLLMYDYDIKSIKINENTSQYLSGVFTNIEDANRASAKFNLIGIEAAKVVEYQDGKPAGSSEVLPPAPVDGLIYRVFLGTYAEGVPQGRSIVFMDLDYLGIESIEDEDGATYYCGSKGLYSEAEEVMKNFTDQGVSIARIVAFMNGEELDVNEARKLTHEE